MAAMKRRAFFANCGLFSALASFWPFSAKGQEPCLPPCLLENPAVSDEQIALAKIDRMMVTAMRELGYFPLALSWAIEPTRRTRLGQRDCLIIKSSKGPIAGNPVETLSAAWMVINTPDKAHQTVLYLKDGSTRTVPTYRILTIGYTKDPRRIFAELAGEDTWPEVINDFDGLREEVCKFSYMTDTPGGKRYGY